MKSLSAAILSLLLSSAGCVWKSDFEALQEKQRNTAGELGAARERVAELEAAKASLEGDLERTTQELQKRIAKLEEELTLRQRQSEERLAKMKEELEEAERTGSEQLARLQSEYDAARDEAAQRIAATQAELEQARKTAEAAQARIAELTKTYDALVDNLQDEIKDKSVRISRLKDNLKIDLVDKILFDSGSAEVNQRGQAVLRKVSNVLKQVQDRLVVVQGHTDNLKIKSTLAGRYPTNWELSAARAVAVVRLLQSYGVPPERLSAEAYGPYQPVASNATEEGRSQNRRIEILLEPILKEVAKD